MNVLWTVNSIMPEVAKSLGLNSGHAISWVSAMSRRLSYNKDIKLAIASGGNVENVEFKELDNILFIVLPSDWNAKDYWGIVFSRFKPDIMHLYGTESAHNKILVERYSDIPSVISLQGILTEYIRHFYAGIDFSTMLRFTTFKDLFFPTGFFSEKRNMQKRSMTERKILQMAKYIEGRSTWDRVSSMNINPSLIYYYCPRLIRDAFYERKWNINNVERYTIFASQGYSPEKGLHFLFEALGKLKTKYPNVRLYVAGPDKITSTAIQHKYFPSGYIKYLKFLIKKYDIANNIEFLGKLSANDVARYMEKSNTVVISSSIENAPNTLAEAMIVGTPIVASFVGGNMDMLKHNKEGYLYTFNEPNMLAEYITNIFESDELATKFSNNSFATARKRHDPQVLESTLLAIYNDVINKEMTK